MFFVTKLKTSAVVHCISSLTSKCKQHDIYLIVLKAGKKAYTFCTEPTESANQSLVSRAKQYQLHLSIIRTDHRQKQFQMIEVLCHGRHQV